VISNLQFIFMTECYNQHSL